MSSFEIIGNKMEASKKKGPSEDIIQQTIEGEDTEIANLVQEIESIISEKENATNRPAELRELNFKRTQVKHILSRGGDDLKNRLEKIKELL